jgi:membrane carboxypeptidase/penicillin-binding protein
VAARLERQFTKDEILGMYLNKVYFGDGLYGVEAASLGYFGKHAADVSVAEAALLAGLVKAPSTYAPTVSVDRARARRNVVLQAMRDVKAIDSPTYDAAVREPVMLDDALRRGEAFGQYFKEEVRRFLVQRFGWERVYQGGLKVYTTVNLDMQRAAEAEVTRSIAEIEKRQGAKKTTGRTRCRPRSSPWTRTPAKCAPWSAAAISSRAHSTARRRRSGSRVRRSSRLSTPPRSSKASRRPRSSRTSTRRS